MMFYCLRRNVEASYHKQFVVVSRRQQTPPRTSDYMSSTHHGPSQLSVLHMPSLAAATVHSTRWSQTLAQNRDLCLPHTSIGRPR